MKNSASKKNVKLLILFAAVALMIFAISGCGNDPVSPKIINNPNATWTAEDGDSNTNMLHAVSFVDANNGWAVGDNGTILHFDGTSWTSQNSGTNVSLRSVSFADASNGIIVAVDGYYLTTSNGGTNWAIDSQYVVCLVGKTRIKVNLNSVNLFNSTTGWATADKGTLFKFVTDSSCLDSFINFDTTITVITETAYDTTFDTILINIDTTYDPTDYFPDSLIVDTIYDTTLYYDTTLTNEYIYMYDDSLFTITDTTVTTQQTGMYLMADNLFSKMWDVDFSSPTNGMAVGSLGKIVATKDGGKTWTELESGTDVILRSIKVISANQAWAVGHNGTILMTSDGGKNWVKQLKGVPLSTHFVGVDFADASNGWAVNTNGDVYSTVDGGKNWEIDLDGNSRTLNGVSFINSKTGWVVGFDGTIYKAEK